MHLGLSKSIKTLADSSFINKENAACLLYGASIVLNDNCKPDIDYIKYTISKDTSVYAQEYLKEYFNQEVQVACSIEKDILTCESEDIKLNSAKPGPYFSYSLEYSLKLKNSIDLTNYKLEETSEIYERAKTCASNPLSSCTIVSEAWQFKGLEQQGDFLIFSLDTRVEYPKDDGYNIISWDFSMKK